MEDIQYYSGIVTKDLLFLGSKSEGYYPVLHSEDGVKYRLHCKGDSTFNEKTLETFIGSRVRINGAADKKRGHWRIVISSDTSQPAIQVIEPSTERAELTGEICSDEILEKELAPPDET